MNYRYLNFNNNNSTSSAFMFGSYMTEDLQQLYSQKLVDETFYFGSSIDDIVEVSLYDVNNNLSYFGTVTPDVFYNVYTGEYTDIDGNNIYYHYDKTNTNYVTYDSNILLNTQNILSQTSQAYEGINHVLYNFIRNIAGNNQYNLVIKEVSNDRKELKLSFGFNINENTEAEIYAIKTRAFARKSILPYNILDLLIDKINNNPIYQLFNNNSENYNYNDYCVLLGLKDSAQLQKYINSLYVGVVNESIDFFNDKTFFSVKSFDGIKNQLINFLYTYNLTEFSKDNFIKAFEVITKTVCQTEILKKTTLSPDILNNILDLFNKILFEDYLKVEIESIIDDYLDRYFGYYKNAINFGNGDLYKILNHSYYKDENGNYNIQIKLDNSLPTNYDIKTPCWISNISIAPVYFDVNLYTDPVSRKVKLTGVNYSVKTDIVDNSNDKSITSELSYDNPDDLLFYLKDEINNLNINYKRFDDFIVYSSAELRTKIAKNKILQYKDYKQKENDISSIASTSNFEISSSYIQSYDNIIKNECNLLSTFDSYDAYLLFYEDVDNYQYEKRINAAVEYDKQNPDSLVNQLPDYIQSDKESEDYIKFTAMIGHFFDNIYCYIKKFPKLSNVLSNKFPKEYIDEFLNTYNWTTFNNRYQNSDLYKFLFENNIPELINSKGEYSYYGYGKELLKRFAANLPYIYKTTGTTKSLELIRAIYGIPSELIQIKEYGSADYPLSEENFYDFESVNYLTKFTNGTEYINFKYDHKDYEYVLKKFEIINEPLDYTQEYTYINDNEEEVTDYYTASYTSYLKEDYYKEYNGIKTFELSFRIDETVKYNFNQYIPLVKKTNEGYDWELKLFKTQKSNYGKLLLICYNNDKKYVYETKELPYFNGKLYTVFIKKGKLYASNNPDTNFDYITETVLNQNTSSLYHNSIDEYSFDKYDVIVNQYDGYVNCFNVTGSLIVDTDINGDNNNFSSGSFYIGNYNLNQYESPFKGNIDKIKVYSCELSDEDIKEHSYNIGSISIEDKEKLYDNLKFLWAFDTPINLWDETETGYKLVNNCNSYQQTIFSACNFDRQYKEGVCGKEYFDKFPYQFDRVILNQAINANTYGPNYKNNVKINKIDENFLSGSVFTPYNYTAKTSTIIGDDSNVVGFYINPALYLENSIENFLGKEGIADIISDPINFKITNYPKLKKRLAEFNKLHKQYIYPEEYYTLYKLYIDFSVFKYAERVVPARTSLKKGLIIEQTQLERQKINIKDIYNSTSSMMLPFYNYQTKSTSSFLDLNKSPELKSINCLDYNVNVNLQNTTKPDYYQYNYNFIEIPYKVDDIDYITPLKYAYFNQNKAHYLIKTNKNIGYYDVSNGSGVLTQKVATIYNFIDSTSSISGIETDFYKEHKYKGPYSQRHLSKFVRVGTRDTYTAKTDNNTSYKYIKGKNDSYHTINREGLLNGSEPIIRIPGFLSLSQSSAINSNNYTTDIITGKAMIISNLTASMENSSSLEELIYNL